MSEIEKPLRTVPVAKLHLTPPPAVVDPETPVQVLDLARCRKQLADAGLRVDNESKLADLLSTGYTPSFRSFGGGQIPPARELLVLGAGGAVGAWAVSRVRPDNPSDLTGFVLDTWTYGTLLLAALCLIVGLARLVHHRHHPSGHEIGLASRILTRSTAEVPLGGHKKDLVQRAHSAANQIRESEVWGTDLFDLHRVRVNLDEEVRIVSDRMRRLTSITDPIQRMTNPETGKQALELRKPARHSRQAADERRATDEVLDSTRRIVEAIEMYEHQVRGCEREYQRLLAAQTRELSVDRMTELLASTGADDFQIDHLEQLSGEAKAATEAIRELLQLMTEPAGFLTAGEE